jgi:hypothetical protein
MLLERLLHHTILADDNADALFRHLHFIDKGLWIHELQEQKGV